MKPQLIVKQKITAFVNKYEVFTTNEQGEPGERIAFVQQRRFAFKEKVEFFTDEFKTELMFLFRAEKAMDIHGKYFVEDKDGKLLGTFRKQFGKSLLNSTWNVLDSADTPVVIINESNQLLAVTRRFVGLIPIIGEFADIAADFFRYHFVFRTAEGEEVGQYIKTTLFRDHYQLNMTDETYQSLDWRVWASIAVALDALQSR
jgi:uncharacterized protein YxjI